MDDDTQHLFITTHATANVTLEQWHDRVERLEGIVAWLPSLNWGTVHAYGPGNVNFDWGSFCIELRIDADGRRQLQEKINLLCADYLDAIHIHVARHD